MNQIDLTNFEILSHKGEPVYNCLCTGDFTIARDIIIIQTLRDTASLNIVERNTGILNPLKSYYASSQTL